MAGVGLFILRGVEGDKGRSSALRAGFFNGWNKPKGDTPSPVGGK